MPSFASDVKNGLSRLVYEKDCCRRAELAALLRMGATITIGGQLQVGLNFTTANAAVARKVLTLLKRESRVSTEVLMARSHRLRKANSYIIRVAPSPAVKTLLEELGLMQGFSLNMNSGRSILRRSCCQAAYLRGAFLSGGSVNRPEASCHLELSSDTYQQAQLIQSLMKKLGFRPGITDRKDVYIVYLKDGESIIEFLAMLEADQAAERLEAARNLKEVRNQVNRIVNCETANLQKTVNAAGRQLQAIHLLQEHGRYDSLPELLREAGDARLAHPDASLADLAAVLYLGKSGLNHRMEKLMAAAAALQQELDKGPADKEEKIC